MDVPGRPSRHFSAVRHAGGAFAPFPVAAVWLATACASAAPLPERQAELGRLVINDCGACHGMTLKGGLGLPLTPDALREKDDASLVYVILNGRAPTPMPPWKAFLLEEEVRWIVARLREGAFAGVAP